MDWITTSGASIDEAKSNALDQLGIVADEAEFDVVNDVEKGLFGRIKTEAKIRARVRPKAPAAKEDRRRRGGKGGRGPASGKNGKQSRNRDGGGGGRSRSGGGKSGGGNSGGPAGKGGKSANGGKGDGGRSRQRQQKPQRPKADKQPQAESENRPAQDQGTRRVAGDNSDKKRSDTRSGSSETKRSDVEHEFSREEQEQVAVNFLEGLVDVLGMSGTVALADGEAEDGAIELEVTGEELGLLVGPKGSTLNSVQELTRTVVQRESQGARTERLRVDVAGYRQRRTAALQEFAEGIAHDVLESGSEKILEPMGPADRKVVHDAVNEIDGVETGSEGEEPRRRVVIRPSG